jgi:prepilin-type N-terminal cleavage/methylation domain-containing protein/prepilin-type processing-associated H-X9-DG protein
MNSTFTRRWGFSLIELLTVLAVLSILLGLLLPAVQQVRATAVRMQCANHLRQIGVGLHGYHNDYSKFPPGHRYLDLSEPYPFQNWLAALLPYTEQSPLWQQSIAAYEQGGSPYQPPHPVAALALYSCPADGRLSQPQIGQVTGRLNGLTLYLGVNGTNLAAKNGLFFADSAVRLDDVWDGTSQTLLVGERPPSSDQEYGKWYTGGGQVFGPEHTGSADCVLGVSELHMWLAGGYSGLCHEGPYSFRPGTLARKCDVFHFWSLHTGGGHFLFCDGSVQFLTYSADRTLSALATRAGGEE